MAATTTTATTTTTTTSESEIIKRNTDCVYFLASPLTCKKGSECEYRHSDIARLNPRDCWYWLSGNCLNPTCAFRHPPLEGLTETSSNSVNVTHNSVATTSRTNVPCYFYFNTYCMKGDQCLFSHAVDDATQTRKFLKTSPEATASHLPVNKAAQSNAGAAVVEVPANPTEGISKEVITETQGKDGVGDTAVDNISEELSPARESPLSSNPDYEEPVKSPDNPSLEDKYINGREDVSSEHSSEELVKDHSEAEERWESSPGFDVLVDNRSEPLAYEDDADYLQAQGRESERLHNHLMHYEYEDSAAYDPMDYPDAGFMYDHCLYDAYEHFNDGYAPDYAEPEPSRERMLERVLHRKRRLSHREWDTERHQVDLRDHLRKRRRMDVHIVSRNSRRHRSSHTKSTSREPSERHGVHLLYRGRLSSELGRELGRNNIRSSHREESALDENHRSEGRLDYQYVGRPIVRSRNNEVPSALDENHRRTRRLVYKDFCRPVDHSRRRENRGKRGIRERQPSLPNVSAIKDVRPLQMPVTSFNGPKTLAQIKEEKRKVRTDRYGSENLLQQQHRRSMSVDFEGPKSLSELLKDKKQFMSASESGNEAATLYEGTHQPESVNGYLDEETEIRPLTTAGRMNGGYRSEFLDDAEEDDEDDLARKVAGILA